MRSPAPRAAVRMLAPAALVLLVLPGVAAARSDAPSPARPGAAAPEDRGEPGSAFRAIPPTIAFQGFLRDAGGVPLDGTTVTLDVALYTASTGGTPLWSETHPGVAVDRGVFQIALGTFTTLDASVFAGGTLWLGVSVDGEPELPRTELRAAPFAFRALDSDRADGVAPGSAVTSLNGLTDDVSLSGGANVTITPSGNTLTIDATGGGGSDTDWVVSGDDMYAGVPGNVGIGTSSPVRKLDLFTPVNVPADIRLRSGASWGLVLEQSPSSVFTITNGGDRKLSFTAGGRFGIGTTTPAVNLHASGGTGPVAMLLEADTDDSGESDQPSLTLTQDGGTVAGALGFFNATNTFSLKSLGNTGVSLGTNDSTRVTVTNAGNVGIGTTNPSSPLHVATPIEVPSTLRMSSGGSWHAVVEQSPSSVFSIQNGGQKRLYVTAGGNVGIGVASPTQKLDVAGTARVDVLQIDGGADLAEPFAVEDGADVRPGTVMAIDPARPGHLRVADRAYDRRVAGIVSGANGVRAGITLRQAGSEADGSVPVALTGRAYCLADATHGAIEAGDLLTTSPTPGHAMKATDRERAPGSILGKAMTGLEDGCGHVLVLVGLQ